MLGQQALNEAACGFYRFAGCGHQVMDGRVQATFRIFFAQRNQVQTDVLQQVFVAIVVVRLVPGNGSVLR